jgi:ferredoxin
MPYVIAQPCVGVKDGACLDVCPVDCIEGGENDPQLYIDPTRCIDCDLCATICPVHAIYREKELPEAWRDFAGVNRDYFAQQVVPQP